MTKHILISIILNLNLITFNSFSCETNNNEEFLIDKFEINYIKFVIQLKNEASQDQLALFFIKLGNDATKKFIKDIVYYMVEFRTFSGEKEFFVNLKTILNILGIKPEKSDQLFNIIERCFTKHDTFRKEFPDDDENEYRLKLIRQLQKQTAYLDILFNLFMTLDYEVLKTNTTRPVNLLQSLKEKNVDIKIYDALPSIYTTIKSDNCIIC